MAKKKLKTEIRFPTAKKVTKMDKPWATCEHNWRELVDSQFHSENEMAVECKKCGCPGAKDTKTGDVFWPAT